MLFNENFELLLKKVRVEAFLNADHAELHDFLGDHALLSFALHLGADRNEKHVGQTHAVNGRDERDGDTFTDFRRVIEHGHDVNQAQNGSDNTDRRRVSASALENLACHLFFFEGQANFGIDDFFHGIRLEAVDDVLDVLFEHRILDRIALTFNGEDALFTGDGRDLDDLVDVGTDVEIHFDENRRKHFKRALDVASRKRNEHGSGGAAEHDDGGRTLKNLAHVAAFKKLPSDDCDNSEENTYE